MKLEHYVTSPSPYIPNIRIFMHLLDFILYFILYIGQSRGLLNEIQRVSISGNHIVTPKLDKIGSKNYKIKYI